MILSRQDIALYYQGTVFLIPGLGVFHVYDGTVDRHGNTSIVGEIKDAGYDGLYGRWTPRGSHSHVLVQREHDIEFAPLLPKKLAHVGYRQFHDFVLRGINVPVRGAKKGIHSSNTTLTIKPRFNSTMARVPAWGDLGHAAPGPEFPNVAWNLLHDPVYLPYPDAVERVFRFEILAGTWHPSFCAVPEEGMKFPALYMEDRIIGYVRPDASVVLGHQFKPFAEALRESGVMEITYE